MEIGDIVLYDHDFVVKIISVKMGDARVMLLNEVQAAFFGKHAGDIITVPHGALYDRRRYMAICDRLDKYIEKYGR